jgi:hypothetical protein
VLRGRQAAWSTQLSLDRLSHAVDEWFQQMLGRLGLLGRIVFYLVAAHFGVEPLLKAMTAVFASMVGAGATSSTSGGTAGGASAAAAPVGASASVVVTTIPSLVIGVVLTGGSVVALQRLAPEVLQPLNRWAVPAIYDVEYPKTLKMHGPEQHLNVWWTGRPRFPVTILLRPREGEPQPLGASPKRKEIKNASNPLTISLCASDYPREAEFRFEVLVRDADGHETSPVNIDFTAVPDKDAPARIPRSQRTGLRGTYRGPCQLYTGDE